MPEDPPVPSSPPDRATNEPASAAPARSRAAFDAVPIFRVVEVVRDAQGRLHQEGKIWHTDLGRLRKFGRAVAANTASHRVVVADASGNVLEEIPVVSADGREAKWSDWEAIPLPPLPPRAERPAPLKRRPQAPPPVPPPSLVPPSLGLDATVTQALQGAAAVAAAAVQAQHEPTEPTEPTEPDGDESGADVVLP